MIKTKRYCDWCNKEITNKASANLYLIFYDSEYIRARGGKEDGVELCIKCAKKIENKMVKEK